MEKIDEYKPENKSQIESGDRFSLINFHDFYDFPVLLEMAKITIHFNRSDRNDVFIVITSGNKLYGEWVRFDISQIGAENRNLKKFCDKIQVFPRSLLYICKEKQKSIPNKKEES